jgi:hypothetical protein
MTDFIKSHWHTPVEICSGKVNALISVLHTAAASATHSHALQQGRDEGAFALLHGLLQVLPHSEQSGMLLDITKSCYSVHAVHSMYYALSYLYPHVLKLITV